MQEQAADCRFCGQANLEFKMLLFHVRLKTNKILGTGKKLKAKMLVQALNSNKARRC